MNLDPKDPNVPATYEIDWIQQLVGEAERSADFEVGEVIRAQRDTGWFYECTTAGRTSAHYPTEWPRASAETVRDGSVVWTCRHPSEPTVPTVDSAAWTVPSGLTLDSQLETRYVTSLTVSGGTDGENYDVLCRMTPTIGNVIEQTITIQVRSQ